jgi:hypothetical protein
MLLDEAAGGPAEGCSQFFGSEQLTECGAEALGVERGEEEGFFSVGKEGLDGLGAGGEDGALLSHVLEKFYRGAKVV